MEKNAKIYIAGHTGLVGSAIWKNLSAKGYRNLIGKSFSDLDLRDQAAVAEFFETEKPDYVFLAAAKVGGIMANNTYRADFIYENLMIQNNIIHQSYVHGVKKLLFLGSTCIYPKEAPQPMQEDSLLTSPLEYTNEPYAIAKIAGIKTCESYNLQYGTNFLSVMPTNLYGPNDNFDLEKSHVLPALIRKIHLGRLLEEGRFDEIVADLEKRAQLSVIRAQKEIVEELKKYGISQESQNPRVTVEIWGSGNPMREFLWSEEMADACVFVMENVNFKDVFESQDTSPESRKHEVRNTHINIGTGKEISIKDLAYLVKEVIGFNGDLVFNSSKPDGTMRKLTDVSKLHSLGWKHKIEIEEGVQKLYDWYRNV
jgi:GDP-L-fucose synthase